MPLEKLGYGAPGIKDEEIRVGNEFRLFATTGNGL
jgi:hypothetical protein